MVLYAWSVFLASDAVVVKSSYPAQASRLYHQSLLPAHKVYHRYIPRSVSLFHFFMWHVHVFDTDCCALSPFRVPSRRLVPSLSPAHRQSPPLRPPLPRPPTSPHQTGPHRLLKRCRSPLPPHPVLHRQQPASLRHQSSSTHPRAPNLEQSPEESLELFLACFFSWSSEEYATDAAFVLETNRTMPRSIPSWSTKPSPGPRPPTTVALCLEASRRLSTGIPRSLILRQAVPFQAAKITSETGITDLVPASANLVNSARKATRSAWY